MSRTWMVVLAVVWSAVATLPALACPPPPAGAHKLLADGDSDDATEYLYARLALCGWDAVEHDVRALVDRRDDEGRVDRDAPQQLLLGFLWKPREFLRALVEQAGEPDAPAWEQAFAHLSATEIERAAQRLDDATPKLVALLRERRPDDADVAFMAEIVLAWRELLHGDLTAADDRLARLETSATEPAHVDDAADIPRTLRSALHAEPDTVPPADTEWIVKQPHRFRCGWRMPGLDPVTWRTEAVAVRHGPDAAIRSLLHEEWKGLISGDAGADDDLIARLRARYTPAELRRAWDEAEASLHRAGEHGTIRLFGVDLPLPDAEDCGEPVRAGCPADALPGRHALSETRWRELVRGTSLYRELYAAGADAARAAH